MRIVLDAMGGDNAPQVEVEGAAQAARELKDVTVVLVGKKDQLEKLLSEKQLNPAQRGRIEIVNAEDVITMSEHPAQAYKQKPDSSIAVSAKLIREGKADALVSAGNTGAVLVASLLGIGRISGVLRPAILVPFPSEKGHVCLLDAGANVDCKPEHLVQFAIMGDLYAKHIMGIQKPTVGVISVGEEKEKGNELSAQTHELMSKLHLNFTGNCEGRDVTSGKFDVVVCDGFVGNVILKLGEGIGDFFFKIIKEQIKKGPFWRLIGAMLLKDVFKELKKKVSADEYGGAPLIGIKSPVIITHGSIGPVGIKNAIKVAAKFIEEHINQEIEAEIKTAGGDK